MPQRKRIHVGREHRSVRCTATIRANRLKNSFRTRHCTAPVIRAPSPSHFVFHREYAAMTSKRIIFKFSGPPSVRMNARR